MPINPKTTINIISSSPKNAGFKDTFIIPKPVVPDTILHMQLKTDLSLLVGIGVATYQRGSDATFIDPVTNLLVTNIQNVARFEKNGFLCEPRSINRLSESRDLSNSAWIKTGVNAVRDALGLDGNINSASTVTATSNNGTVFQEFIGIFVPFVISVDIKRKTGTETIEISKDGGLTFLDVTGLINSITFTRFELTDTLIDPSITIKIGSSGDAIIVDYPQLEVPFTIASSRIDTIGLINKERLADDLFIDAVNVPSETSDYSISAKVDILGVNNINQSVYHVRNQSNRRMFFPPSGSSVEAFNGNSILNFNPPSIIPKVFTVTVNQSNPSNGFKLYSGFDVVSGPIVNDTGTQTNLFIGSFHTGFEPRQHLLGHITDLKAWDVPLSQAEAFALNE